MTAADGAEHVVELKLTEEEAAELEERRRRVVPDAGADGTGRGARPPSPPPATPMRVERLVEEGGGLPRRKNAAEDGRGDLYVEVTLSR